MSYLTEIVNNAMAELNEDRHNTTPEMDAFLEHVKAFSKFYVTFPDNTTKDATDEEKAEELARIWLANRLSKTDDPNWRPSRQTMRELGITITGLLEVSF